MPDFSKSTTTMDAIRKKMQSLKGETDSLYATIQKFEDSTKESNRLADQVIIRVLKLEDVSQSTYPG